MHTRILAFLVSLGWAFAAEAQTPGPAPLPPGPAAPAGTTGASQELPVVTVIAPKVLESQPTDAASEQRISGETLNERPVTRPGEILEAAPGLIVTQHSGEGKANQYFLRGFNLDHGTDIGIWLDGMPINLRTHAHGQGYSDLNFMMPELVESLLVRKGPYWADEGDFSSAGALHLAYANRLDKDVLSVTGGSFGYWRGLAAGSIPFGKGTLTGAGEIERYDGPWDIPDALRKYNAVVKYTEGTEANGLAITGMAYTNSWHSSDQIPLRAVTEGLIGRFGQIDPSDGGNTSRYSLSARFSSSDDKTADRLEAYVVYSTLNLFNDFTFFLNDPVNGDQFQQVDKRWLSGLNASHSIKHTVLGYESESTFGLQVRSDDINLGLYNTMQQTPISTIRTDHVIETSAGLYYQVKTRWSDWLRSILGVRGDMYWASDESDLPGASTSAASFIPGPKASLVFGPFDKTEYYFNAGMGFHSNDARGLSNNVPLLVQSRGAEIGARTQAIKGLDTTLTFFYLDFDSELTFDGDTADTEPNRASRRIGVEFTNRYRPVSWAMLDGDFAYTYARFQDNYNPIGDLIPEAPAIVASAGITLGEDFGWFGVLRWRFFGARPLIEDGTVWSGSTSLVDARIGYTFDNGLKLTLDALNLFNTQADQIDYFYASRLPGESAAGVNDIHFKPVEPLAFRLTLAKTF